jgi:hypothetical protein
MFYVFSNGNKNVKEKKRSCFHVGRHVFSSGSFSFNPDILLFYECNCGSSFISRSSTSPVSRLSGFQVAKIVSNSLELPMPPRSRFRV